MYSYSYKYLDSIKCLCFFKNSFLICIVDGTYVVELYTFSIAKPLLTLDSVSQVAKCMFSNSALEQSAV